MPDLSETSVHCAVMGPQPMLDAFEGFQGTVFDAEAALLVAAAELRRARDQLLRQLGEQGVGAGDRVVVAISNGPVFHLVLATLVALGAAPILLHAETPWPELERCARRLAATAILVENSIRRSGDSLAGGSALHPASWADLGLLRHEAETPAGEELVGVPLHPTSGTSGEPKIALRPGPCAMAEAAHYIATMDIGPQDTILCATPMSHAYAYGMCVTVPWLASAHLVTVREFNPRRVLRAVEERGVTLLPAVPAMFDLLLRERRATLLAAPRLLLSAGAPLPSRTAAAMSQRHGKQIHPLFGTTETGGISVFLEPDGSEGGVGPPMAGVETRLRPLPDLDAGEAQDGEAQDDEKEPRAGVGLLEVRSSSMMAGYLTASGIDRTELLDGWLATGDLASFDSSGGLRLHGRGSDIINVFGLKVIPSEVESVISALPQVEAVQVYAGAHRSGSEVVQAAVVTSGPLAEEDLRRHCLNHLVHYKCPSRIYFLDALPRTPSGKVIRNQLPMNKIMATSVGEPKGATA